MTTVEIPEGSGNKYRYEYEGGSTVYKGPVGDSPQLTEEEFMAAMDQEPPTLLLMEDRRDEKGVAKATRCQCKQNCPRLIYYNGSDVAIVYEGRLMLPEHAPREAIKTLGGSLALARKTKELRGR